MSIADQQLASIKKTQKAALAVKRSSKVRNPVSFIIRAHAPMPMSDLVSAAQTYLKDICFDISTLFCEDETPSYFVLNIHDACFETLPGSPVDLARRLKDQLDLLSVAPV